MPKITKALVAHPFFFAVYPVFFLFSQNIAQVSFNEILVPTMMALGLAVTTFLLTVLVFKDSEKAGIITFHIANNYGAVLQSYALAKTLEKLDFNVKIIDYQPEYLVKPYHKYRKKI